MKKTQKETQIELVLQELSNKGYVTNFWAIKNRILRLGAIIYAIRNDIGVSYGLDVYGAYGNRFQMYSIKDRVKNSKNFHYYLVSQFTMDKKTGLLK